MNSPSISSQIEPPPSVCDSIATNPATTNEPIADKTLLSSLPDIPKTVSTSTPIIDFSQPPSSDDTSLTNNDSNQLSVITPIPSESSTFSKEVVDGIDIVFKTLSNILEDVKNSSNDSVKANACEVLGKIFVSDKIASQVSLERELEALKENLHSKTLECDNLRMENYKLRNSSLDCENLRKKNNEPKCIFFLVFMFDFIRVKTLVFLFPSFSILNCFNILCSHI